MKKFLTLLIIVISTQQLFSQLNNIAFDKSVCGLKFIHKASIVALRSNRAGNTGRAMPITFSITELNSPNYVIEKAFVWSVVSYIAITPLVQQVTVVNPMGVTTTVNSTMTGEQGPKCWNEIGTRGYRADVTGTISGNGNYTISTNTSSDWTDGLTFLIIYRDTTSSYKGTLIIHDGLITDVSINLRETIDNINACGNSTLANAMLIASDIQANAGTYVPLTLNGSTSNFSRAFWNSEVVSTNVTQYQDRSNFGVNTQGSADCFSWLMIGLYYQANAASINLTPLNSTICPGDAVTITANGISGDYEWNSIPPGLFSTSQTITVTPSITTKYYVRNFNGSSCFCRNDTATVTVLPKPQANAGPPKEICPGSFVSIGMQAAGGTPPFTYYWTPGVGLFQRDIACPIARPTVTTKYYVTVTDSNGCTSRDSVIVRVLDTPKANAGADKTVCKGYPVYIGEEATGGSPPYTYNWSPSQYLNVSNTQVVKATVKDTTKFILTITDSKGCVGRDTVFVYPLLPPIIKIIPKGPTTFCSCDSLVLNPDNSNYIEYKWSFHDTATVIAGTRSVTVRKTGWYYLTITDQNGCRSKDSVYITVMPVPTISSNKNYTICKGSSTVLTVNVTGGTPSYKYKWTPAKGLSTANIINPLASPDSTTLYILTVTDSYGCIVRDTINVIVNDKPIADAGKDTTICLGSIVKLGKPSNIGTPPFKYSWSPKNGLNRTDSSIVMASPAQKTTYIFTVTDSKGCSSSDTIIINVSTPPLTKIKALTPISICAGDSVLLKAEPVSSKNKYYWSTGETSNAITVRKEGKIILIVENEYGCKTSDSVNITVNVLPDVKISSNKPPFFCEGDSILLSAEPQNDKYKYLWSTHDTGRSITVKQSGTFILKATNEFGCSKSDTIIIKIAGEITAKIEADGPTTICGNSLVLRAVPSGNGYAYLWSTGETTSKITAKKSGRYWLKINLGPTCEGNDSIDIILNPIPVFKITGPSSICTGTDVTLGTNIAFASYLWSTGAATREITIEKGGRYKVTVTDTNGCTASDSVNITEKAISIAGIEDLDMGMTCSGNEIYKDLIIKNEGLEKAVIKEIKFSDSNSDFSTATYTNTIQSGQNGYIRIKFNSKAIGHFKDSIFIRFSEPCFMEYAAEIKAAANAKTLASLPVIIGKIGQEIQIPLSLKLICGDSLPEDAIYKSNVSLDATALKSGGVRQDTGVICNGVSGDNISFSILSSSYIQKNIKGIVMLALTDTIPLIIDSLTWNNDLIENENQNGTLIITGLCRRDLLRTMYLQSTYVTIIPNPASDEAEIRVEGAKTGLVDISVFSIQGIKKQEFELNKQAFGTSGKVKLDDYGQGIYQVVVRLGEDIVYSRMVIVK